MDFCYNNGVGSDNSSEYGEWSNLSINDNDDMVKSW